MNDPRTTAELCELAKAGDKFAMDELYRQHVGIIVNVAKRYARFADFNEAIQAGAVAFVRSVWSHDPNRGELHSLVAVAARRAIVEWLRTELRIGQSVREHNLDNMDALTAPDLAGDLSERLDVLEKAEAVLRAIPRPRDRDLVVHRFGLEGTEPCTYDQLAATRGISRERVRQRITIAFRKVRRELGKGRP